VVRLVSLQQWRGGKRRSLVGAARHLSDGMRSKSRHAWQAPQQTLERARASARPTKPEVSQLVSASGVVQWGVLVLLSVK